MYYVCDLSGSVLVDKTVENIPVKRGKKNKTQSHWDRRKWVFPENRAGPGKLKVTDPGRLVENMASERQAEASHVESWKAQESGFCST